MLVVNAVRKNLVMESNSLLPFAVNVYHSKILCCSHLRIIFMVLTF